MVFKKKKKTRPFFLNCLFLQKRRHRVSFRSSFESSNCFAPKNPYRRGGRKSRSLLYVGSDFQSFIDFLKSNKLLAATQNDLIRMASLKKKKKKRRKMTSVKEKRPDLSRSWKAALFFFQYLLLQQVRKRVTIR